MSLLLSGAQVYTATGILVNDAVKILNFPANYHLVPGFIDLHTHGANGADVMDATPDALATISKTLAAEGTTAFLATTMTASVKQIDSALKNIHAFMQASAPGAAILGVHLEGPFLAATKMGAQQPDNLCLPDVKMMAHWNTVSGNTIRLVTLAPELAGSDALIKFLRKQNIIASIGHTNATFAEANSAIAAGCTHATHLFNAMRGIMQREPGTVTAALLAPEVMAELIVDGVHLHPAIVKLALATKGKDKIVLITDAMRAKCLADGCYDLGGQMTAVKAGQVQLADGTLAGSVLQMSSALQNVMRFTDCSLADALLMAATNPARQLGLAKRKGCIAEGMDADLVVLDDKLQVVLTICGGRIVFENITSPLVGEVDAAGGG
jgi:N-acetylglucosamine-6-phosphate deacetylase